jgi:hypothetical protein
MSSLITELLITDYFSLALHLRDILCLIDADGTNATA